MIRLLLMGLGVIALGIGFPRVALALLCPEQPKQISKDFEGEVNAEVAKIGPVSGGGLKLKTKQITTDLLEKAQGKDRIYLEQMMYASYCSSLKDNTALSKEEISRNILAYNAVVRGTIETKQPAVVPPPSKQPGKKKASGPQSKSNPPVLPLTQAEPKQPAMQKSQPAVSPNPSISQHSAGANSPNIAGNQNVVVIANQPSDAKLDEIRDLLRQSGYPDNPSKLLQKYPLGYTIYDLTYVSQVTPYEKLSVLNDYEVDWSQAKVIQNTQDKIALRLPDLKRKDGRTVISGLSTGGSKKVGPLACGGFRNETGGIGMCGEIIAIREDGIVFLVNLMEFPPTMPK
jgi:hypothetical protein